MFDLKFFACLVITSSILLGCGGGESSSDELPQTGGANPETPQTPISDPSMVIHLRKTTVYEGEVFQINADDAGENVSIKQISGPQAVKLENVNSTHYQFRAPNSDANIEEIMTFKVEASKNGVSRVKEVAVTVVGFEGPGRVVGEFDTNLKLVKGDGDPLISYSFDVLENVIALEDRGNEKELVFLSESNYLGGYSQATNPVMSYIFSEISAIKIGKLGFNLQNIFAEEFLVLQEESNSIKWFVSEHSSDNGYRYVSYQDEIAIENPCEFVGKTSTAEDFVWIGQRNKGFSTVRLEAITNNEGSTREFNDSVIQSLVNGRSHCLIYPTKLPEELVATDYYTQRIPDLIALDYNTNEIVFYADVDFDEQYEEISSIPLQTNSSATLQVVDAFSVGWPTQSPRYIVVLLTDGVHKGKHRLVVVSQDPDDSEIHQSTFSWEEGVPISLIFGTFSGQYPGDQYAKDIVVVRKGIDTALYFDNVTPYGDVFSSAPTFSQPVTFQIGNGAESAVLATPKFIDKDYEHPAVKDILVSYPASGQLRVFRVHDELKK